MSELQEAYERGYNRGLSFRADETYDDGFSDGILQERSRIIKLLEAECERPLDPKWSHYREECSCAQIALIKGEK